MNRLRVVFVLTAFAFVASGLTAQRAKTGSNRSGQWVGFGLGPGVGRVSCAICSANRQGSYSGYFRAGGTLSRKLLLGLEADGWMRSSGGVGEYLIGLAGEFYFYPNAHKRLFYKAGLGVMHYQSDDDDGHLTSTAFGANLGIGYDVPMNRSISLTPFASVFVASFGSGIKFNGDLVRDDMGLMLIQAGVGVSWY